MTYLFIPALFSVGSHRICLDSRCCRRKLDHTSIISRSSRDTIPASIHGVVAALAWLCQACSRFPLSQFLGIGSPSPRHRLGAGQGGRVNSNSVTQHERTPVGSLLGAGPHGARGRTIRQARKSSGLPTRSSMLAQNHGSATPERARTQN